MFCCTLLYVHSSIAIILMGKRELVALLNLSSWCLVMVERLFLVVPRCCLRFVIVVFPDHTHLLFLFWGRSSCDRPHAHCVLARILCGFLCGCHLVLSRLPCLCPLNHDVLCRGDLASVLKAFSTKLVCHLCDASRCKGCIVIVHIASCPALDLFK